MAWRVFDLSSIELRAEAEAKGQGYLVRFCLRIFLDGSQKSARRLENSTLCNRKMSRWFVLGFVSL